MHPFAVACLGGCLIGLSASLLLLGNGRVAGISGILGGLFDGSEVSRSWRVAFLVGLMVPGLVAARVFPAAFDAAPVRSLAVTAVAGVLVGFGTRLGQGCTSGHGICGLARFSRRSLVAVVTFIATAAVTVFLVGHFRGGFLR